MRRLWFCAVFAFLVGMTVALAGCQREAPDTRAANEQAIRNNMDVECLKAAQTKDLERRLLCFAQDASMFPPGGAMAAGKEAIRALLSQLYANPGFAISWQTTKVEVSRASDLAWCSGTYELTLNDPKGKPITDRGKYVTVWKKHPDGSWKAVAEIWNSDQPPPARPEH